MTINNIVQTRQTERQLQTMTERLSSGQRVNSARDDAAGLGIGQKMEAQIRGLERAISNVQDMQSLVNTAEGGLSGINDNLLRMRELTIASANDTNTPEDRANMQAEVAQLAAEIDSQAANTQWNGMRLLDGSFNAEDRRGLHTAADANGRGPMVSLGNMSFSMIMGPGEYNIGAGFNPEQDTAGALARIDNALMKVNSQRSYLGAMSNRFDSTIASNQIANLNQQASRSRIMDQDMARGISQYQQLSVMLETQTRMQAERQEQEKQRGATIASMTG